MPDPRPSRASRARRALASSALWPASVWLLASACGPGAATPMPEPPAFDLSGLNTGIVSAKIPTDSRVLVIESASGNVPSGAAVRVTNLDGLSPVVAGSENGQGGFEVDLIATDGQELRFEWVNGDQRSAPADAIVSRPDAMGAAFTVAASQRFDCLKLEPGYVLDFGAAAQATFRLENGCSGALTLENPRTRLALTDFAVSGQLPPRVAAGKSASISVDFTRAAAGLREDVLFVDVTLDTTTLRYPITLRAE